MPPLPSALRAVPLLILAASATSLLLFMTADALPPPRQDPNLTQIRPPHALGPQHAPRRLSAAEEHRSSALMDRCTVRYRDATLDHFSWAPSPGNVTTFKQRYFLCLDSWTEQNGRPIFFYAGNEADVTLYLNNTGLMWESAPKFGAGMVFAEHRYYGESLPYGRDEYLNHLQFLTVEQAMADYAELVMELKEEFDCHDSAVIAFGGSYGGMLASWMRMKYPHVIDGAIASSAPILAFDGLQPPYDSGSYAKAVTYDATPEAGASSACTSAVRSAWAALRDLGATDAGREQIRTAMGFCPATPLDSPADALGVAYWVQSSMDYIAMGNFPYETSYITNGGGVLPPFPMRVGCGFMTEAESRSGLLSGLAKFAALFYNASGDQSCLDWNRGANPDTDLVASLWDYQSCTEMYMPMSRDGVSDMFWPQPWSEEGYIGRCKARFGAEPRPLWALTQWGGRDIGSHSNMVFANGEYDPWRGGGVLESPNDGIVVIDIPGAAHHLDLMFSNPGDTSEVKEARAAQLHNMNKWILEKCARTGRRCSSGMDAARLSSKSFKSEGGSVWSKRVQDHVAVTEAANQTRLSFPDAGQLTLLMMMACASLAGTCVCCVCCTACRPCAGRVAAALAHPSQRQLRKDGPRCQSEEPEACQKRIPLIQVESSDGYAIL